MLGLSDEGEDNESSPIISSILSPTEDGPPTVPIGGKYFKNCFISDGQAAIVTIINIQINSLHYF